MAPAIGTEGPETETGRSAPPGRPRWYLGIVRVIRAVTEFARSLSLTGIVVGTLALAASTTPSLIPRGWLYQGVISGISLAVGYAVGAGLRWLAGTFGLHDLLLGRARALTRRWLLITLGSVGIGTLITGTASQRRLARLWGIPATHEANILSTAFLALAVAVLILLTWRGLVRLARRIARLIGRWVPRPAAAVVSVAIVVALVVGLVNGLVHRVVLGSISETFQLRDTTTREGVVAPTLPERSGSPGSHQAWDTLGYEGRRFVAGGPDAAQISAVTHRAALEPIRVYAGLASQPNSMVDADLDVIAANVVSELDRTNAWDRKVLAVVTTTGTGWVDPWASAALEYLQDGDTAIAAMQYSPNPSWVTLMLDIERPRLAGRALFEAVSERWRELPEDDRPMLVVYGLSLGSYGSQAAFTTMGDFAARADGAVWAGTPRFTPQWAALTDARDAGTPQAAPVLDGGTTVRWATQNEGDQGLRDLGETGWPRVVYLQNPSDGVVWWWPRSFISKDDWYSEPPGQDVIPGIHWWPVISGLQLTGDMFVSGDSAIPNGWGHHYGAGYVDAWEWVTEPAGWDADSLQRLREIVLAIPN